MESVLDHKTLGPSYLGYMWDLLPLKGPDEQEKNGVFINKRSLHSGMLQLSSVLIGWWGPRFRDLKHGL